MINFSFFDSMFNAWALIVLLYVNSRVLYDHLFNSLHTYVFHPVIELAIQLSGISNWGKCWLSFPSPEFFLPFVHVHVLRQLKNGVVVQFMMVDYIYGDEKPICLVM